MSNEFFAEMDSYIDIQIQDGPIKENGVNGCQIDDVIIWCQRKLHKFNSAVPSQYNDKALYHLNEALKALLARTEEREARGVEGTSQA